MSDDNGVQLEIGSKSAYSVPPAFAPCPHDYLKVNRQGDASCDLCGVAMEASSTDEGIPVFRPSGKDKRQ